jgi:flagellar protein FliO/FliZ
MYKQKNKAYTNKVGIIFGWGWACLLTCPALAWAEQAPPSPPPSAALAQTTFGLLFVLGLLMLLAWLLKRAGLTRQQKRGGFYKVLATSSLGPREKIVLVEIGDTWLVLGMTANSINTLHSMPAGSLDLEPSQNPAVTFAKLLERIKKNPKVEP